MHVLNGFKHLNYGDILQNKAPNEQHYIYEPVTMSAISRCVRGFARAFLENYTADLCETKTYLF